MAPKESQDAIKEFGRPEYEGWLAQFPHTQSPPSAQVEVQDLGPQVGARRQSSTHVLVQRADTPPRRGVHLDLHRQSHEPRFQRVAAGGRDAPLRGRRRQAFAALNELTDHQRGEFIALLGPSVAANPRR
jgi:hypothetical protein